ncbi:MAG: phosphotransferase [Enterococcus faecium]|uniref:Phosphotransferase n=1 Tax=Enterococcus mundtii TaxID=53346 RepID=A0A2T5DFC9_ENTMU|nr:phosphotransferase [Enterococcus mundtii]MBE6171396.1 phosphotransferase [Enterococcus faecium]PTO36817.1 phosphotransferase [Enterococcus mundtii]
MIEKKPKGRDGVVIQEEQVIRPKKVWSEEVQKFLSYLRNQGVTYVPEPLGYDEQGNEVVSYLAGEVYDYPLPPQLLTDSAICSAGRLLRDFHDQNQGYLTSLSGTEPWMLHSFGEREVMCHNDFAPYNVTTKNGIAIGIIDFDTITPGSRIWDVSYAAYRWVPLEMNQGDPITDETCHRLKKIIEAYRLDESEYQNLIPTMIERLSYMMDFITKAASHGEANFQKNIQEGHLKKYEQDIQWLLDNEKKILRKLQNEET